MTCTLITATEARRLKHMDAVMHQAREDMAHARRTRTCVWCAEPVGASRVYPACEDCRDYRGVTAP